MKIAPSMLACNFSKIGNEIKKITEGGADLVHLDVMDGNFVPNISFGAAVIKSMREYSSLPFDVHLMIQNPHRYIEDFANAGADIITFHVEAERNIKQTIEEIKSLGIKPGLVIKPNTRAEAVVPYIKKIYMVLVMTVEPGFGGQSFMEDMMPKISLIKNYSKEVNPNLLIEVDGGINLKTIPIAAKYGADICVAGTSVFNSTDTGKSINELKIAAN